MAKTSVSNKNRILSRLSAADKALLQPDLEPVDLTLRQVLETPNRPITHSYFIGYGLASIIAKNSHKRLEVGLIGCEGFTGLPIVLGNDRSPHETFMQVPRRRDAYLSQQAARGDFAKSLASTCASKVCSCVHESDGEYSTLQRHRHSGGTLGTMAAHGE